MNTKERGVVRDDHAPSMAAVRSLGVLGCIGAAVLLEHGLAASSVAAFALGAITIAVSFLALRAPSLFWSPRASASQPAPSREKAPARLASGDR